MTSTVFHTVQLTSTSDWKADEVVPRSYVDDRFSNLIDSAPGILDTLGEIAQALQSGDSAAVALAAQVTSVQTGLTAEIAARAAQDATEAANLLAESTRALAAERLLSDRALSLEDRATLREQEHKSEVESRIAGDAALAAQATADVTQLRDRIQQTANTLSSDIIASANATLSQANTDSQVFIGEAVTIVNEDISALDLAVQQKFPVSDKYSKDADGHFKIDQSAYLIIGDAWRIAASFSGQQQRLVFEHYSATTRQWSVAVPFIRAV